MTNKQALIGWSENLTTKSLSNHRKIILSDKKMAGERVQNFKSERDIQRKTHTYQEDKTNVGIIQNKGR